MNDTFKPKGGSSQLNWCFYVLYAITQPIINWFWRFYLILINVCDRIQGWFCRTFICIKPMTSMIHQETSLNEIKNVLLNFIALFFCFSEYNFVTSNNCQKQLFCHYVVHQVCKRFETLFVNLFGLTIEHKFKIDNRQNWIDVKNYYESLGKYKMATNSLK